MFGRIPRLPIDVIFQHALNDHTDLVSHLEFVTQLKRDLSEAAQIVQKNTLREQTRHAKLYNRKVKGSPLAVGDRVLLANRGEKGKRKIADKWESTPYEVMSVRPAINVYRVKNSMTGKEKVVHRNLMLSVNFFPLDGEMYETPTQLDEEGSVGGHDSVVPNVVEGSDERTISWLMQCDDAGEPHIDVNMVPQGSPGNLDEEPDVISPINCSDSISRHSALDCSSDSSTVCSSNSSPRPQPAAVDNVQPLDTTNSVAQVSVICTQPTRACTRVGRVIRPPLRLICEMNDQALHSPKSTVGSLFDFVKDMLSD